MIQVHDNSLWPIGQQTEKKERKKEDFLTTIHSITPSVIHESIAIKTFRPFKSKPIHQLLTTKSGILAERPTGHVWLPAWDTFWDIHGTEEFSEVGGALDLDQGKELMDLNACVILCLMAQHVWKAGSVVLYIFTQADGDWLTNMFCGNIKIVIGSQTWFIVIQRWWLANIHDMWKYKYCDWLTNMVYCNSKLIGSQTWSIVIQRWSLAHKHCLL